MSKKQMKAKHKMTTVIKRKKVVITDRKDPVVEMLWNGEKWIDLTQEKKSLQEEMLESVFPDGTLTNNFNLGEFE
jgi:hypothetical protein